MSLKAVKLWVGACGLLALGTLTSVEAQDSNEQQVARGKYLVAVIGCGDCHTSGYFFGKPDMAHALGGSDVGFEIPQLGVFVAPNLTSDAQTGLGDWTKEEIVAALQTGKRPDGRELAPIMPWQDLANLTREDAMAIAAYLKTLPPIKNKVPGPFAAGTRPTVPVMKIVVP
ncbi:MAG: cytochrome c [Hyphomicrobiales bacterium]|nr:cytochrome c [Hyphomicrobiales bacterium]MBV9432303.1 cytochrome c [Hyphomicrobiales bacterium]